MHQARYANEGRTAEGEVLSQRQTSHVSGRRARTRHLAYQLAIAFKLPDGTPVSKSLRVENPIYPSADGKMRVSIRYLPSDPEGSAKIDPVLGASSDDGHAQIETGLWWAGLAA